MLEQILDEALKANGARDFQRQDQIIHQLADMDVHELIAALRRFGKAQQSFIMQAFRFMGYPRNEPAIPELIYEIGDPNLPGRLDAVAALVEMGPDVAGPHLIQAILEKGAPYHVGTGDNQTWGADVEGLCGMLWWEKVPVEYALVCCPAIYYWLTQADLTQYQNMNPDVNSLLDVIERAGVQVPYVLPMLFVLAEKHYNDEVRERAKVMIAVFPADVLAPYKHLLLKMS